MQNEPTSFTIIGPGAMGSLVALTLHDKGIPVKVLGKSRGELAISRGNNSDIADIFSVSFGEFKPKVFNAEPKIVITAVKAFDLPSLVKLLLPGGHRLNILSNGLIYSRHHEVWKALDWIGHIISYVGVSKINGVYRQYGSDAQMLIGAAKGDFNRISDTLPFTRTENIAQKMLDKWLINTPLNSLCGKYLLPRNELALKDHEKELWALAEETWLLGEKLIASGLVVPPQDSSEKPSRPPNLILPSFEAFKSSLIQTIRKTAGNMNSMAFDRRSRGVTESDYFAGLADNFEGFAKLKAIHSLLKPNESIY